MKTGKCICFFNSTMAWGGGEKWHHDIAIRLAEKGYKVIAFTNKGSALYHRLQKTAITCYPVQVTKLSFLNLLKVAHIARILQKEGVSTIILNLSSDVKLAGMAAKKAGVSQIIYRRGLAKPIKNRLTNRLLFKHVITQVICNSEETRKTVFAQNPDFIAPENVSIIYNGIDLDEYLGRATAPVYQKKETELVIGNAGRLVEQKGQFHLIALAKRLKAEALQFKILVAGSGTLAGALQQKAKEEGVSECFKWLGFVDDIKAFMQSIDVFVLTSYWEGFGYVLVEAMALGKPVVAWNTTSNPEVVKNEENGFLVSLKNEKQLSEKVAQLAKDDQLREKMGRQAAEHIAGNFTIEQTIRNLLKLIG